MIRAVAIEGSGEQELRSTVSVLEAVRTPVFNNRPYGNGDPITLFCATSGAAIHYSVTNNPDPDDPATATVPTTANNRYQGSFPATGGNIYMAYAVKQGMNPSANTDTVVVLKCTLSEPEINFSGNTFTITADPGANIWYNTTGNELSPSTDYGELYNPSETHTIPSGTSVTIQALAARSGCNPTDVVSQTTCYVPAPSIAISPSGQVTITPAEGTTTSDIRYTTDGSTPIASSSHYEGPFSVVDGITVKAITVSDDCVPVVAEETYSE